MERRVKWIANEFKSNLSGIENRRSIPTHRIESIVCVCVPLIMWKFERQGRRPVLFRVTSEEWQMQMASGGENKRSTCSFSERALMATIHRKRVRRVRKERRDSIR